MNEPLNSPLTLAAEFPATHAAEWRELVDVALKGASFEKRLVSQTYDGLRVEPLYPRAVGVEPVAGRKAGAAWTIMQRVDHPDPLAANKQALSDLENGATGLTLVMAGSANANGYGLDPSGKSLKQVLNGVEFGFGITIDIDLSAAARGVVRQIAALVKAHGTAAEVHLRTGLDPVGSFAATGATPMPWSELSKSFAGLVRDLSSQGFAGPFAVADSRIIHNAGGSEAQELAFAIASALEYLRALEAAGMPLDAARDLIYFRLTADADEFLTIAKFRALRKLWARVEQACGLTPKPTYVAAETAWRMLTKRDPNVNLLRMTIAVAAAGLAGADSILALPHTLPLGLPDAFARRVARNTQLVLLEESNLAKVSDPAAGSGAIEALTSELCAAAWTQFQDIEKAGGAWAALESGLVQKNVAAVRAARQAAIARRKDTLIGTSDYPLLGEKLPAVLNVARVALPKETGAVAGIEPLPSIRLAEPFEALRDKSDAALAKTGLRPKVFLATLGRLADFTPRAMFAKNFYEAGGIEALGNDGFKDQADMVAAFKKSGATLACLCGSDVAYAEQATSAAKALADAGAVVHLAGRPGEQEAALKEAGVKTFVFVGGDVLSTLSAAYDRLNAET
ncbi:MAG: methylmalonyl-CoA mutase subunit beta [Pseudolabrys sp.]|nr:methylmalonyl-CoA mutase subunit beta [Pseudolabrys sp.]